MKNFEKYKKKKKIQRINSIIRNFLGKNKYNIYIVYNLNLIPSKLFLICIILSNRIEYS